MFPENVPCSLCKPKTGRGPKSPYCVCALDTSNNSPDDDNYANDSPELKFSKFPNAMLYDYGVNEYCVANAWVSCAEERRRNTKRSMEGGN